MPSPNLPTAITICHLLDPFIESVAKYGVAPGQEVSTYTNPAGALVQVKVAPLVSDLEATRKASGFLDHSATMFCSVCLCRHDEIENLDFHTWQYRNGAEVRQQAEEWLSQKTTSAREVLQKASGVCWSPFFHLPYWDPVRHVLLGFMHNWLEGILKHHLRTLWGLGRDQNETKAAEELEKEEYWTEQDITDSASELEDLAQEMQEYSESIVSSDSSMDSASTVIPTPGVVQNQNPYPFYYDESDDESDPEFIPIGTTFSFSNIQISSIHDCIQHISLPTWVQQPPTNLGQASHGKLKAREYLTLFTTIFPLIIPEFWYTPSSMGNIDKEHFLCFYHLISATNIVSFFQTCNTSADDYMQHYIQYRSAIQKLFPDHPSKPNHHYAMHNSDFLKYWGPLPGFSEFPGERLNGNLQKTNTNNQLRE